MGENTGISWAHSTFNPWRGCQRVSPGCEHCYAETLSKRNHKLLGQWGPPSAGGTRVIASPAMWHEPLKWDARAAVHGLDHRVFCSSLADVFEGLPELEEPRRWLWALIAATPHLTWMLLTKRPQNVMRMVPRHWVHCDWSEKHQAQENHADVCSMAEVDGITCPPDQCDIECGHRGGWPQHVWIGTTVEDQKRAVERVPLLLGIPAAVRFLSVEPQLELVNLAPWLWKDTELLGKLHWVIQGGESGPHARQFDLLWANRLREQCAAAGVAYFFKQTGSNPKGLMSGTLGSILPDDRAGADPSEWPVEFRVQQFPNAGGG